MSGFDDNCKLWYNGEFIRWRDAKIHVMSHVVHYGSSVFEGIRAYPNSRGGAAVLCLDAHIKRLHRSAKLYRMEIPFSEEQLRSACVEVLKQNDYLDAYIRPVVFRGYGTLGVDPRNCPVDTVIGAWPWGKYLGSEALEQGVDVRVSSWQKMRANTLPTLAKAGGNYLNSQLAKMEAAVDGYVEGILLDANGYVSEGSGENIFVLLDGKVYTSPLSSAILPGITRHCAITLLQELGMDVVETYLPREMMYLADEIIFTGTAAEITPVRSIDRMQIGSGKPGEMTKALQERYFAIVKGEAEDKYNWLTPIS